MNKRRKLVSALGASALAVASGPMMSVSPAAQAADVNMAEVRRLAREPVETIFAGAPVGRISDTDYWKTVRGSPKPVVVVFYANQGQQFRHLATLARYLAREFSPAVAFYGYSVTAGTTVEHGALAALQKRYGVKKVPATLFYDNERQDGAREDRLFGPGPGRVSDAEPSLLEYLPPDHS